MKVQHKDNSLILKVKTKSLIILNLEGLDIWLVEVLEKLDVFAFFFWLFLALGGLGRGLGKLKIVIAIAIDVLGSLSLATG